MSDAMSREHPLSAYLQSRENATVEQPGIEVVVRPSLGHINLRGNPDSAQFLKASGAALGMNLPLRANTAVVAAHSLFWLGPDEWLVVTEPGAGTALAQSLRRALAGQFAAITEIDGGQVLLQLSGDSVRDTLAKGCTLDLHPDVFTAGACAQTGLAKSGVLLARTGEDSSLVLVVRRSFAEYVARWLAHAGREYGIRFDSC